MSEGTPVRGCQVGGWSSGGGWVVVEHLIFRPSTQRLVSSCGGSVIGGCW